jgi:hypothetical protein
MNGLLLNNYRQFFQGLDERWPQYEAEVAASVTCAFADDSQLTEALHVLSAVPCLGVATRTFLGGTVRFGGQGRGRHIGCQRRKYHGDQMDKVPS